MDLRNDSPTIVDIQEASLLNNLVERGVVDPLKVERADLVELGEMIIRYYEDIADFGSIDDQGKEYEVPKKILKKINVLFGDREKREPDEIERIEADTQKIIDYLAVKTGLPITGAIVHGSRADLDKRPQDTSDLDICLYINTRGFDKKRIEMLVWQVWTKALNLPYKVKINEVFDRDNFLDEVDTTEGKGIYVPFWGWNPEAFRFVGKMMIGPKELTGVEATNYLRTKLKSDEMQRRRKRKIMFIESEIERYMKMELTILK